MKTYPFQLSRKDLLQLSTALTYDDVTLEPEYSEIRSRKDVDLSTKLTKKISLKIPIVAANMNSVTEAPMAIAIARQGGIGIIHRYKSIQETVQEIKKVKRWRTHIIEDPYTINKYAMIEDAEELMIKHNVSGLLVTNGRQLLGILTSRDMKAAESLGSKFVEDVMTPYASMKTAPVGISQEEAKKLLYRHKIEKLPIVDENGLLYGLVTAKDIKKIEDYKNAALDSKGRLLVGAATGTDDDYIERADALVEAGVDVLVVDIAQGHAKHAINTVEILKSRYNPKIEIIAGNVATEEGVRRLIEAGADCVKVGIGGGSVCTTREVTGAGVPQLTAIARCVAEAEKYGIPIIADGGIRKSGDICKAIVSGAHTVMLGNMLAGTDESPGKIMTKNGRRVKGYMGMASEEANLQRTDKKRTDNDLTEYSPEGVAKYVPYKGPVEPLIKKLLGGLRSGASYVNARNIEEYRNNHYFIRGTSAAMKEATPHVEGED